MSITLSQGSVAANSAGMIAKSFATSLAIEKAVSQRHKKSRGDDAERYKKLINMSHRTYK
jgi:hypothetical protein